MFFKVVFSPAVLELREASARRMVEILENNPEFVAVKEFFEERAEAMSNYKIKNSDELTGMESVADRIVIGQTQSSSDSDKALILTKKNIKALLELVMGIEMDDLLPICNFLKAECLPAVQDQETVKIVSAGIDKIMMYGAYSARRVFP